MGRRSRNTEKGTVKNQTKKTANKTESPKVSLQGMIIGNALGMTTGAAAKLVKEKPEETGKIVMAGMGTIPQTNVKATTKEYKGKLEEILKNIGEGLKTGAIAKVDSEIKRAEQLIEDGRELNEFFLEVAVMMVQANEADLRMQGEIMSGAAQKVADTAEEALEIGNDICDIGEALKAYLKGEYDDFIERLGKGIEEICKEIGMVLEHPIEALKGEIEEKKEAIANATPKDFGYFAMGIVLDFLGPAAVKKAGKVIKTIAKHVRKPGGINAEKPSGGKTTGNNLDKVDIKDKDREEKEEEGTYPPRTEEARRQAQIVAEVMAMKDVKGNSLISPNSNSSVTVFTHEDGTVSVGFSGQSGLSSNIAKAEKLQNKLNEIYGERKYTVSALTIPSEIVSRKEPFGCTEGNCSEPKAAMAAYSNNSPITGMDTVWRGNKENKHKYDGSGNVGGPVEGKYEQMRPCDTCADPINIKEYMKYANHRE